MGYKNNFSSIQILLPFQSSMLKKFPISKRNGAHFLEKKDIKFFKKIIHYRGFEGFKHKKKIWFVSSFEHVNFAINGKYSKKNYDNPKYASFAIFQT